jgi:purine-binding chemotaxis protein CheW
MVDRTKVPAIVASKHQAIETIAREYLSFVLDSEVYGIELSRIQSIMVVPEMTEVPRAPRHVVGICSVRGVLVSVVDLRRRMALPERPLTRQSRVLLTTSPEGESIGLLVDAVRHVVRPKPEEVELTGPIFGNEITEHVVGIARVKPEEVVPAKRASAAAEKAAPRKRRRDEVIVLLSMDSVCGPSLRRLS